MALLIFICRTLFEIVSGPCVTPVCPVQRICVGPAVGVSLGNGVCDGVKITTGVNGLGNPALVGVAYVGVAYDGVYHEGGVFVAEKVAAVVMVGSAPVEVASGVIDGVLDSAAKPVGRADPKMGMETRIVRALADTISRGLKDRIGKIGWYVLET